MSKLTSFNLYPLQYKCSLNTYGPKKYGTLEELITYNKGEQSLVGTKQGHIFIPEIRQSNYYKTNIQFKLDESYIEQEIKKIVPEVNHSYVKWLPEDHKYDVIEYFTDGFFDKHIDRRTHKLHYATLLIFPPAINEFAHTGGDLIIDDFNFESSTNVNWTFIIFHPESIHEVKKVLSGRRIVIKTDLKYTSKLAVVSDFYDYNEETD